MVPHTGFRDWGDLQAAYGTSQETCVTKPSGHVTAAPEFPGSTGLVRTECDDAGIVPIGAFRCTQCGYLEYYARPEFGSK
jgi:hypothetical protein